MPPRKRTAPQLSFIFTPQGFVCDVAVDPQTGKPNLAHESLEWYARFEKNRDLAFYDLGFLESQSWFTPSMRYLHRVAEACIRAIVQQPDVEIVRGDIEPSLDERALEDLLLAVPFVAGAEHVGAEWVACLLGRAAAVFKVQTAAWGGTVEQYVAERTQNLRVAGRVFFHLVDNPSGTESGRPFAFLATYATTADSGSVEHLPLRYALTEFKDDQHKLLALIGRLGAAAQESDFVSGLMESGELFHPLALDADEAYAFLRDIPVLEEAGVMCRVPNWWKRRAGKPAVSVRIGQDRPSALGAGALLSCTPSLLVDGCEFTRAEIAELLERTEGLALIKGRWVEVDHERLRRLLEAFDAAQGETLTFFEALRETGEEQPDGDDLRHTTRGEWLDSLVHRMRTPVDIEGYAVPESLDATLRPYQQTGFSWLSYLTDLGFGSCLADDMGLGKTVQVLAYIERLRAVCSPHVLLVVPASLLGNWTHEIEKFAPHLDYQVLYGQTAEKLNAAREGLEGDDLLDGLPTLTLTTYAMAQKIDMLGRVRWDALILDEAQAIKNPNTKQTKALKGIASATRIALTGTPVENDLSNLWSLFDFLNPGLLGTAKEFKSYVARMEQAPGGYAPLRQTIAPFILRRLKTDRSIIADLPEKVEMPSFVELTKKQVALYNQVVDQLARALDDGQLSDIKRSGLVLASITKLKQICNHPDQFLGQEGFADKDSGKFQVLQELCRTIYEKRERVLVFTQFREMCAPLDRLLAQVFERPGLVIHGQVPAKRRTALVERFQGEEYVPYMVLSLKAGGTGLNLTAANNVIHFDRWWNPAVENQATDRAFRIGQQRDVMVYKFICESTLEERIDQIISDKSRLLDDVVGQGESWLGKMPDDEIMQLVRFGKGA